VLVPLYIYPTAESWEPLFSSARLHTGLDFVVVVNPNNGPGCHPTPDDNYMTALQRLSQLPNVKVLGYIYCSYGNRPSAEAEKEVRVYHGWTDQGIRIDGIFFDEVPPGLEHLDYMADISTTARTILLGLLVVIVYNPGIFTNREFYSLADFIVVFENQAAEWDSDYVRANLVALPAALRARSIAIAHS
ncbi:Spherulation-specific family 4, partial [Bombardia bombarda]